MKTIAVRADASRQIGSGHVMRCLTLADELRSAGAEVFFICRTLAGDMNQFIEARGYRVYSLDRPVEEQSADAAATLKHLARVRSGAVNWLVVDHYGLDISWEAQVRPGAERIMAIDDLADRAHDCDLLLDQNLYEDMERRYAGLVPGHCIKLLGPGYALLRPEFKTEREKMTERSGVVKRILIFFGGADQGNETVKALQAIELLKRPEFAVDVVVGASNPHRSDIKRLCSLLPDTSYHCQVDNMAELMARADISIGAGGSTTWERCYLGLPAIVIATADNQVEARRLLSRRGAEIYLGRAEDVDRDAILQALQRVIGDSVLVKKMSSAAEALIGRHKSVAKYLG